MDVLALPLPYALSDLLLLAFAVWRISNVLVNEPGIFSVFQIMRDLFDVHWGQPPEDQSNVIAGILSCVWCCSFWIGLLASIAFYYEPETTRLVLLPFAISAGAILVHRGSGQ